MLSQPFPELLPMLGNGRSIGEVLQGQLPQASEVAGSTHGHRPRVEQRSMSIQAFTWNTGDVQGERMKADDSEEPKAFIWNLRS